MPPRPVSAKSLPVLTMVRWVSGTELDFKVDKLSSTFVFNNPNQTSACGCGESVSITPRKDVETTA